MVPTGRVFWVCVGMAEETTRHYLEWCARTKSPVLILRTDSILYFHGKHYTAHEGQVHECLSDGKPLSTPLGKHIPRVQAYLYSQPFEVVVRWHEPGVARRIESLRWRLMSRVKDVYNARKQQLFEEVRAYAARTGHPPVAGFDDGTFVELRPDTQGDVDYLDVEIEREDVLGRLALTSSVSEESEQLIYRYDQIRTATQRCFAMIRKLNGLLNKLFQDQIWMRSGHAVGRDPYDEPYDSCIYRKFQFIINGRHYVTARLGVTTREDVDLGWPTPWGTVVDLDNPGSECLNGGAGQNITRLERHLEGSEDSTEEAAYSH